MRPWMEYVCYNWVGASSCYLNPLDKLKKRPPLSNPRLIVEMLSLWVFSVGISLVDVHVDWLDWFHVLIHVSGPLVILISWMIFLWLFLDVVRMSMPAVSYLALLVSIILSLQNSILLMLFLAIPNIFDDRILKQSIIKYWVDIDHTKYQ